jgi:hypothetical protein
VPKALDMVRAWWPPRKPRRVRRADCSRLVSKANDQPTMDLLTQRLEVHEKDRLDAAQPA